ncbi:THUMP-like domain-containing protein [Reichenbachiella versicolor]|uniref:THUMP-like domain-containing protein n=1 Tax=Reichenbachiella versicolor TaxID=1821036 RepID=UPI000D6DE464|nr:hypothetical protein [Reichenbachiella versicolor]
MQELRRQDIQSFIKKHEKEDPVSLVLSASKFPSLPIQLIAAQIKSRQKAITKLPSLYKIPDVIFPHGVSMEQCSSEATARYKAQLVEERDSLTDLSGGFGIDTYFFSQRVKKTIHVEKNPELSQLALSNYKALNAEITCIHNSAENYLKNEKTAAKVYYIDPARRDENNKKVFALSDCQPDLTKILPEIEKRNAKLIVKLSPMLDIEQAMNQLNSVNEIHTVSVDNECKELLFIITKEPRPVTFHTINLLKNGGTQLFLFSKKEEEEVPSFSMPSNYLYEPNASIMKAGGFNSISNKLGLTKLHRNSHLYSSPEIIPNFPGRSFKILKQIALNKKKLKAEIPSMKANLTVRNYPQDVSNIRKKTGLKEGGQLYIFATTLMDGTNTGILCEKIN